MKEFDLTGEIYREYDIPGRDDPYKISYPRKLFISESGTTHRVLDNEGIMHCIPFAGQGVVLRWCPVERDKPCNF